LPVVTNVERCVENLRDFLQLALVDGKGTPDKKRVAASLKGRVSQLQQTTGTKEIRAACAETLILGIYLVQPYQLSRNYISEIEVWALMAATLLHVACLSGAAKKVAFQSLGLMELGVWEAMQSLVAELQTREDYIEGDVWTDAYFYRARMTHIAGFLSAAVLWEKWFGEEPRASGILDRFWQKYKGQMCLWAEGAIPSFLAVGWAFDQISARWEMESLVMMLISQICQLNHNGRQDAMSGSPGDVALSGLANPYISLSDVLLEGIDRGNARMGVTYVGRSFALESLVKILARRRLRQHLASLWPAISAIAFETYAPIEPSSLWNWSNGDEGYLESKYTPQPTSWAILLSEVESPNKQLLPALAADHPHMLLLFILTAPHRLNPSTALILERCKWTGGAWLLGRE
jgi:hypothetical protein